MNRYWMWGAALIAIFIDVQNASAAGDALGFKQESNRALESYEATEERRFYAGIGYGVATSTETYSRDERSKPASKLFIGYMLNGFFGTELAYINLGDRDNNGGSSGVLLSKTSFVGSAVGTLPLGDTFALSAKLGVANYETATSGSTQHESNEFAYGVIAAFKFGEHFGVRGEYEIVGVSRTIYRVATMSAVWRF